MDGVSIVIFTTQKMWMTKGTALKNRMLFRRISSVNRCRQNVPKEVSRTRPLPRKSLKRQRVRRSKIATRAQHSRAALVAQVYIAELGELRLPVSRARSFLMCHKHSCSISTSVTFHFLNVYFRIFLHPDGSHENDAKECIV